MRIAVAVLTVPLVFAVSAVFCTVDPAFSLIDAASAQPPDASADASALPADPPAGDKPAAAGDAAPATNEPEKEAGPALPSGFKPSPNSPPEMEIENELLTKSQSEEYEKQSRRKVQGILRGGAVNSEAQKEIEELAKWLVFRMTIKENREKLYDLRGEIFTRYINIASSKPGVPLKAREVLIEEVAKRAAELLDGHNFYVRLNAVLLLSELNIRDADTKKNIPEIAYTPALDPLLAVLQNEKQPLAVRINAVRGLGRILMFGRPKNEQKNDVALALINQLKKTDVHPWFQVRLVQALGNCDVIDVQTAGAAREQFAVVQALATVMADRRRSLDVRCEAARALGRAPINDSVRVDLIGYKIVELAHEMAAGYQVEGGALYGRSSAETAKMTAGYNKNLQAWFWKGCYLNLYLAFKPANKEEQRLYTASWRSNSNNDPGLLSKRGSDATLREAYQQLLPVVKHVLEQPKRPNRNAQPVWSALAAQEIQAMETWLKSNQPQDNSIAPSLPPISQRASEGNPGDPDAVPTEPVATRNR